MSQLCSYLSNIQGQELPTKCLKNEPRDCGIVTPNYNIKLIYALITLTY